MPSITLDGHTLSVDGRRLWVVAGAVHYALTPRHLWASRLRAAREAGLNTIEVPVIWALHEPRQGKFTFDAELDLAAFIKQVDQHGMHAIVRIGPCVGDGLDLGGMPAWLPGACAGKLRSHAPEYLARVSGYISAVCDKIANLQVTGGPNRRGKGPIIAVVAEHRWLCGDDGVISLATNTGGVLKEGTDYLAELARYLREGGINVPVIANNDLYHCAEGQVEAWSGMSHLHANLRQLRSQRPGQPRLVMSLCGAHDGGGMDTWGEAFHVGPSERRLLRAYAEALAAGGQFCVSNFAPGTRFGFLGGRIGGAPDSFVTPSTSAAVVPEGGGRSVVFHAVKRIATFASSFERVLCGLDPSYQPVTVAVDAHDDPSGSRPGRRGGEAQVSAASVVHANGSQGSLVFVFAPGEKRRTVRLVLGDGSTLPVTLESQDAAWVLLDTHLGGRATLDYCNVNAFALAGKALVCYAPAGSAALFSINGTAVELTVPEDDRPLIQEIEGVALALCNERSIDRAIATPDGVWFGAASLDAEGSPVPLDGASSVLRLGADGSVRTAGLKPAARKAVRIAPADWTATGCEAYTSGESPRFARIDRPAPLDDLGTPYGYAWMRVRVKSSSARRAKVGLFEAADRVHLWADGESLGVFGFGPAATPTNEPVSIPLRKGETSICALIDNLGRSSDGSLMGEPKGLFGHLWEVSAIKCGAPKLRTDSPLEPLKFRTPIMGLQIGDATDPVRLTWKFAHRRRSPVFACVDVPRDDGSLAPGLVIVNGVPVAALIPGSSLRLRIDPEQLKGTNELQLAIVGHMEHAAPRLKGAVKLFAGEDCLSEKSEWGFAKWEPPGPGPGAAKGATGSRHAAPMWWRAQFTAPQKPDGSPMDPAALFFDASTLSKGQLWVNGHNVGRYFSSAKGRSVGPQTRLYIPDHWIRPGAVNEVLVFDEHGKSPSGCRIVSE